MSSLLLKKRCCCGATPPTGDVCYACGTPGTLGAWQFTITPTGALGWARDPADCLPGCDNRDTTLFGPQKLGLFFDCPAESGLHKCLWASCGDLVRLCVYGPGGVGAECAEVSSGWYVMYNPNANCTQFTDVDFDGFAGHDPAKMYAFVLAGNGLIIVRYSAPAAEICGPATFTKEYENTFGGTYPEVFPASFTASRTGVPEDCGNLTPKCCEPSQLPCNTRFTLTGGGYTVRKRGSDACREYTVDNGDGTFTEMFRVPSSYSATVAYLPWCPCADPVTLTVACRQDPADPNASRYYLSTDGGVTWPYAAAALACYPFSVSFTGVVLPGCGATVTVTVDGANATDDEWPTPITMEATPNVVGLDTLAPSITLTGGGASFAWTGPTAASCCCPMREVLHLTGELRGTPGDFSASCSYDGAGVVHELTRSAGKWTGSTPFVDNGTRVTVELACLSVGGAFQMRAYGPSSLGGTVGATSGTCDTALVFDLDYPSHSCDVDGSGSIFYRVTVTQGSGPYVGEQSGTVSVGCDVNGNPVVTIAGPHGSVTAPLTIVSADPLHMTATVVAAAGAVFDCAIDHDLTFTE